MPAQSDDGALDRAATLDRNKITADYAVADLAIAARFFCN